MKKEIADKWIKALRSDKYEQGRKRLCSIDDSGKKSYCCLGVLCDILGTPYEKSNICNVYCGEYFSDLPKQVMQQTGIKSRYASIGDSDAYMNSLADFNDSGMTFNEIASEIEKKWELL